MHDADVNGPQRDVKSIAMLMRLMDQITKSHRDADVIDGSNHQIAARC